MRHIVAVLIVLFVVTPLAWGQALVERVPDDALLYVGWRGAEVLGPAYDNSHLAAVLGASNFRALVDQTLPQILKKIGENKPEYVANIQAAVPLLQHLWKRPTALFLVSGKNARGRWEPNLALVCDAGPSAADFYKSISALVAQAKDSKTPIRAAIDGTVVAITLGYADAAMAMKPKVSMRDNTSFVSAMKQVGPDPAYISFVNADRILKAIDAGVAGGRDKAAAQNWPKIRDALGLGGLKSYISTGGFDGKDWSSRSFIDAPSPRTGLLTLLGEQPVRDATLQSIPKTASYLMVTHLDPGKLLADTRAALKAAPQSSQSFESGLAKVKEFLGRDLSEILDPLGDEWAIYTDLGVGGANSEGIVVASELDDAAKAEAGIAGAINSIVKFLANPNNQMFSLATSDVKFGDEITVHQIIAPQGLVAWTIKDKHLYFGLKPKAVGAATLASKAGGGKFTENEKYKAVKAKLDVEQLSGMEFSDLPQTAPQKHAELVQALMVMNMFTTQQGVQIPNDLLPPMNVLQQHLSPAGAASYVDAMGWHRREISPFPGSGLFASQQVDTVGVGGSALMVSILLPSLNRARETANRVKCASNERQIGQAILLYSNDNKGKYPPDLAALVKTQDIAAEVFTCSSSDNELPDEIKHAALDVQAKWVNEHSSYVYVGAGMNNAVGADVVVLYERADDHDQDGMNILWGDGHVTWEKMVDAQKLIGAEELKKL